MKRRANQGFSLVETLVVLTIMLILITPHLPAHPLQGHAQGQRSRRQRSTPSTSHRQIRRRRQRDPPRQGHPQNPRTGPRRVPPDPRYRKRRQHAHKRNALHRHERRRVPRLLPHAPEPGQLRPARIRLRRLPESLRRSRQPIEPAIGRAHDSFFKGTYAMA